MFFVSFASAMAADYFSPTTISLTGEHSRV
jgi:hypothetical protein